MDTGTGTEASSGAALGLSFAGQLKSLSRDQKGEAFQVIRNEMDKHELFQLRSVLGVPSSVEVTPESIAKRVSEEAKHLTKVMTEHAGGLGRAGVKGAVRFVTEGAVLEDVDWKADLARKASAAPILMAVLASVLQAESWYYDRKLMENFVASAKKGEQEGCVKAVSGRLLRVVDGEACDDVDDLLADVAEAPAFAPFPVVAPPVAPVPVAAPVGVPPLPDWEAPVGVTPLPVAAPVGVTPLPVAGASPEPSSTSRLPPCPGEGCPDLAPCKSLSPGATDEWCTRSCASSSDDCPKALCKC